MGFEKGVLHINRYEYDFDVDGGATGAIALRNAGHNDIVAGCHIKRMWLVAETAFTGTATPTCVIGNTTDADGYFTDIFALVTTAAKLTVSTGEVAGALVWDDTNDHTIEYSPLVANDLDLNMTVATQALTAGKMSLFIEFYRS